MSPRGEGLLELHFAQVTPSTCWVFVRVCANDGVAGWGEATLPGSEARLRELAPAFEAELRALPTLSPGAWGVRQTPLDLPTAALTSAIDMALWDIAARSIGRSVADVLTESGPRRGRVALYANINRRTGDRTPAGFAWSAQTATQQGFTSVKVAAFDEAGPGRTRREHVDPGLQRLAAVREAIGPDVRLMVDCHWRLDEAASEWVVDAAADLGLYWVECPLPETPETLEALVRLRSRANRRGVLLAGGERAIGRQGFAPYLTQGAYDVMMPDAKYVGGLAEMMAIARQLAAAKVIFSPHNPTGPICHAASLQACAAVLDEPCLELQFDETPAFDDLQVRPMTAPLGGYADVPTGPGLGVELHRDILSAFTSEPPQ